MKAPTNKAKTRTFSEQLETSLRATARKLRAEAPAGARWVLRLLDRGERDECLNLKKGNRVN
jgi:hypothetical protein